MKMSALSLLEWQRRFSTEEDWTEALTRVKWPDGFIEFDSYETKSSIKSGLLNPQTSP